MMSPPQRHPYTHTQAFMNDPPTTIFLLSAQLASVGLTLVSANHMFLVSERQ
jgi:SNF2 family DNA or RNA helicase